LNTNSSSRRFYGWWLLAFLGITYTIQIGFSLYGATVLLPFMSQSTGWSRGETMVGYTMMALLLGLSGPVAALMINRFGARATLFTGGIIIAVSASLMGFLGHIYTVYIVLCVFTGLGTSLATMLATQSVIVSWFNVRRAFALGSVLGGGAIGGFIAPQILSAAVLAADGDWRLGWFIIAITAIVGAVVAILAVRNRPSDLGQYPDGINPDQAMPTTASQKRSVRTYRTSEDWTMRQALKSPALWLAVIAMGADLFLWQVVQTQAPFHLRDRAFTAADAAFFFSLAVGFSILGRFAIAALGDTVEPRFLLAGASILILLGGVLFWFVSPEARWTAYVYPLLAGFGFGAAFVCLPTILGNYFGVRAFASINGIAYPIAATIQSGATPAAGFLYDIQGSYFTILLVGWAATAIAFIAMLLCRPPKPKES